MPGYACDSLDSSPHLRELEPDLKCAAAADLPTLVSGEAGVGKEWVARFIHANSRRSHHPFHTVDCDRPPAQVEADWERLRHSAGILYLREVGALNPPLQECVAKALGSKESHARIIAGTRRDLYALVTANSFSTALFYRANLIHLVMPPLRERRADVPTLLHGFLPAGEASPVLDPGAVRALMAHDWPGNVRELQAVAARLVARGLTSVTAADVEIEMALGPSPS